MAEGHEAILKPTPPKPISEMTDAELREWAGRVPPDSLRPPFLAKAGLIVARHDGPDPKPPTS